MSVPPEIAQALTGGAGGGTGAPGGPMPPPSGGQPKPPSPSAGPMMTPQPKAGNQAGGRADIQVTIKKLTMNLQQFPPGTEQGDAIMKAIATLTKAFGETASKDKELMPAEIAQAVSGLAGPGKPPPGLPMPAGPAPLPQPM